MGGGGLGVRRLRELSRQGPDMEHRAFGVSALGLGFRGLRVVFRGFRD